MPPPPKFGGRPVTNIRNTSSPRWRDLAQAGKPLTCASQQLFRIRAGSKSRDRQEGRGLVRNQRRASAVRVRRPLDHVQGRSRPKVETGARFALGLWTPDNSAERELSSRSIPKPS